MRWHDRPASQVEKELKDSGICCEIRNLSIKTPCRFSFTFEGIVQTIDLLYHLEMALLTLRDVSLGFRGPPLLDEVNLTIEPRERVCVLGRNGTGKSTLLRLLDGQIETDRGDIARQQGLVTAMLPQEVPQGLCGTVFDEVARGLGPARSFWRSIII